MILFKTLMSPSEAVESTGMASDVPPGNSFVNRRNLSHLQETLNGGCMDKGRVSFLYRKRRVYPYLIAHEVEEVSNRLRIRMVHDVWASTCLDGLKTRVRGRMTVTLSVSSEMYSHCRYTIRCCNLVGTFIANLPGPSATKGFVRLSVERGPSSTEKHGLTSLSADSANSSCTGHSVSMVVRRTIRLSLQLIRRLGPSPRHNLAANLPLRPAI